MYKEKERVRVSELAPSKTFETFYSQNFKLDSTKYDLSLQNKEEWPTIYVNANNEAVRNIDVLLALKELHPHEEVRVCLYDLGEHEAWYVVSNANKYGNKTNATRLLEIEALREYFGRKQGQRGSKVDGLPYNSAAEIAEVLDISVSLVGRLEKIKRIVPRMISLIDAAEKVGGKAKLSVSGVASACDQFIKAVEAIEDKALRDDLYKQVYESELIPDQLVSLVQQISRKVKSGTPLADAAQSILLSSPNEIVENHSEMVFPDISFNEVEVEFEEPEERIKFTLPESAELDPEMLFEVIFPQPEAAKYLKRFVDLVKQIHQEVSLKRVA